MAQLKQQLGTLRQKDANALRQQVAEAQQSLQKAKVDLAFGRLKTPSTITNLRKQVARTLTILAEKEATNA